MCTKLAHYLHAPGREPCKYLLEDAGVLRDLPPPPPAQQKKKKKKEKEKKFIKMMECHRVFTREVNSLTYLSARRGAPHH